MIDTSFSATQAHFDTFRDQIVTGLESFVRMFESMARTLRDGLGYAADLAEILKRPTSFPLPDPREYFAAEQRLAVAPPMADVSCRSIARRHTRQRRPVRSRPGFKRLVART